jgi:hypothetical protein
VSSEEITSMLFDIPKAPIKLKVNIFKTKMLTEFDFKIIND